MEELSNIDLDGLKNIDNQIKPLVKKLFKVIDENQQKNLVCTDDQIIKFKNDLIHSNVFVKLETSLTNEVFRCDQQCSQYFVVDNNKKYIFIRKTKSKDMYESLIYGVSEYVLYKSKEDISNGICGFKEQFLSLWSEATIVIKMEILLDRKLNLATKRVEFLKAILKINNFTYNDIILAYNNRNSKELLKIMPEYFLINISKQEQKLNKIFLSENNQNEVYYNHFGIYKYIQLLLINILNQYIKYLGDTNITFKALENKEHILKDILNVGKYIDVNTEDIREKYLKSTFQIFDLKIDDEIHYNFTNHILHLAKAIDINDRIKQFYLIKLILRKGDISNAKRRYIEKNCTKFLNILFYTRYLKALLLPHKGGNVYTFIYNYIKIPKSFLYKDEKMFIDIDLNVKLKTKSVSFNNKHMKTVIQNTKEGVSKQKVLNSKEKIDYEKEIAIENDKSRAKVNLYIENQENVLTKIYNNILIKAIG